MISLLHTLSFAGIALNVILSIALLLGIRAVIRDRNIPYWSARHVRPLEITVFIAVVFIICERNIQLLSVPGNLFELKKSFSWLISNIFMTALLICFVIRCWVLHYDYNTGLALLFNVTDSELKKEDRDYYEWFLVNKLNYGSPNYLTRFSVIFTFFLNLVLWGWSLIAPKSFYYGLVGIYAVLILIGITITNKIGYIDDIFFMREELLTQFRILSLFLIISGGVIAIGPAIGWNWALLILIEMTSVTTFLMLAVSLWWVPIRCSSIDTMSTKQDSSPKAPPIDRVLTDSNTFIAFLRHLVRELQHENIFFLIDIVAFKRSFVTQKKLKSVPGWEIQVPTELARLRYVPEDTFIHYAWSVNKFYIDGSSAYYLTSISEDIREHISLLVEGQDPTRDYELKETYRWEQLATAFDPAAEAVFALVKQSYYRFINIGDFQSVAESGQQERQMTRELDQLLHQKRHEDAP